MINVGSFYAPVWVCKAIAAELSSQLGDSTTEWTRLNNGHCAMLIADHACIVKAKDHLDEMLIDLKRLTPVTFRTRVGPGAIMQLDFLPLTIVNGGADTYFIDIIQEKS